MKNNRGLIFTLLVLFMLSVVLIYYLWGNNGFKWYETYQADGDQPFDLGLFQELLKKNAYQGAFEVLESPLNKSLPELDPNQRYNIVSVKRYYYPDTSEIRSLLDFLNEGNNLYLSSELISPLLPLALNYGMDTICTLFNHLSSEEIYAYVPDSIREAYEETYSWEEMDSIHDAYKMALQKKVQRSGYLDSAFVNKFATVKSTKQTDSATLSRPYKNKFLEHQWSYLHVTSGHRPSVLARYDQTDLPVAVKFEVGKGSLVVSSTPLLYTNFFIRKKQHFNLINDLLGSLPQNTILFDDISRYSRDWSPGGGFGANVSQSPLSFILSQRELSWAWFTLLGTALLFVLFRSKRRQRIIPVVKPNHNTTLAYAQLLGSLQLKEKHNTAKANEIFQHFLQHLRARNRWHGNTASEELKIKLLKLAPDLNREIEIVLHLGSVATKKQAISNQQLINLFNYTNLLIQRT